MTRHHESVFRVYYEDTDAGGVVYYANYLKFAERARTEMLREAGISQSSLITDSGVGFVARQVIVDLLKPARLDDELIVHTKISDLSRVSVTMQQKILCKNTILATLEVKIVSVLLNMMKPVRIPDEVITKLGLGKG